jgi:hypothetical protein
MKNANGQNIFPYDITPEEGAKPSSICGVDPDFKMPQVWKTSLAIDYSFPTSFPLSITAEGIFNKTINAASISDWSIPSVGGFAHLNGADARPIYHAGYRTGTKAFVLENTSRGYGWSASVQVNAQPTPWMDIMAAYTQFRFQKLRSESQQESPRRQYRARKAQPFSKRCARAYPVAPPWRGTSRERRSRALKKSRTGRKKDATATIFPLPQDRAKDRKVPTGKGEGSAPASEKPSRFLP